MRSSPLLDFDAQAVRIDVDLDDLPEQFADVVGHRQADFARVRAATMPACRAAPRATTSLTASELSGALPLSSCEHLAGHRHVRRAADQQNAVDLLPAQARLRARPAARSAACASADRASGLSNSARVSGTVNTWPAWVQVMLACGSLLRVRLAARRPAVERGQRHADRCAGRRRCCLMNLLGDVIDDAVVPVLAAQPHVAFDGERLEAALRQPDQRHVEGAAAEVVDQHRLLLDRQHAVGIRSRRVRARAVEASRPGRRRSVRRGCRARRGRRCGRRPWSPCGGCRRNRPAP